jgi:hypothetical protein
MGAAAALLMAGFATPALLMAGFATPAQAEYKPKDVYVEAPAKPKGKRGPRRHHDGYDFIRVEGRLSPKAVIVPVRTGPLGKQVKLPGGSWVYCEITCEYTVRRLSVDFWDDQGQSFTSPGYIRRDFYLDRRY